MNVTPAPLKMKLVADILRYRGTNSRMHVLGVDINPTVSVLPYFTFIPKKKLVLVENFGKQNLLFDKIWPQRVAAQYVTDNKQLQHNTYCVQDAGIKKIISIRL